MVSNILFECCLSFCLPWRVISDCYSVLFLAPGIIPKGHWSYPEWIDVDKATALREQMGREGVIYGDSLSYRHMCRYEYV